MFNPIKREPRWQKACLAFGENLSKAELPIPMATAWSPIATLKPMMVQKLRVASGLTVEKNCCICKSANVKGCYGSNATVYKSKLRVRGRTQQLREERQVAPFQCRKKK